MTLSIIIPVLNEAASIGENLQHLISNMTQPVEIIVVDGGSDDNTIEIVRRYDVKLISSDSGRAKQMNVGAAAASGDMLLFLHSDTILPDIFYTLGFHESGFSELTLVEQHSDKAQQYSQWGFFKIKLDGRHWMYRVIESMINLRSGLTRIATGDQCIFVASEVFDALNGYKDIPLMEDVELSKRLNLLAKPRIIKHAVTTSSRRWEHRGILSTIVLMWRLRFLFFIGVAPKELAKSYSS